MIAYEEYRARLDQCLDERREPLDDGQIVAFLDAHPECLEEFAELRADLRAVTQTTASTPTAARPHMLTVAAACLVIGFGVSQLLTSNGGLTSNGDLSHNEPAPAHPNQPDPLRRSRILSASLKEVEPRLHAAANYTLHEPLVQTKTITLEAYEHRSELR